MERSENLIVAAPWTGHGLRILLRKPGRSPLDIGEKECDRAGGKVGHTRSIQGRLPKKSAKQLNLTFLHVLGPSGRAFNAL